MREIIPLANDHKQEKSMFSSEESIIFSEKLLDQRNRPLNYLRISVLDQCNFRCPHCMPAEIFDKNYFFMKREQLLSFEEIKRIVHIFTFLGVKKVRLTGGEPLLRKNIEKLVEILASIQTPTGGFLDVNLTTNGTLLFHKSFDLKKAGLRNITVSLDALDPLIFSKMTGEKTVKPKNILKGIEKSAEVGFSPVKINMVVRRGINEGEIMPMVRYFRNSGHILRFIEYMDVGNTNDWSFKEVVTSKEIRKIIEKEYPLIQSIQPSMGRVANTWKYKDGSGEIGFISSVTEPFCGGCNRIRLSAEGKLFTCLFSSTGYDLRSDLMNDGISDAMLASIWSKVWKSRNDNYSEIRNSQKISFQSDRKIEMSYIGG